MGSNNEMITDGGKIALEFQGVISQIGKKRKDSFRLQDISFALPKGYICGIAGKNGAGKTSLLRLLMDRGCCYEGQIKVWGLELAQNRNEILDLIGYVSDDNVFYFEYSAQDNARLLGGFYKEFDMELFLKMIQDFDLHKGKRVGDFSRGQYMKFQLAFAVAHHSRLYLIDEATAGMDIAFRKEFFDILRKLIIAEDASVLLVTHLEEEIKSQVDYAAVMECGKLLSYGEVTDGTIR